MGWKWRQVDILWLPQLERKQACALEICDSASWYLAERNGKKIAHRYTTTITVFFFIQVKIKQKLEQLFQK